jgi:phage gp45-like
MAFRRTIANMRGPATKVVTEMRGLIRRVGIGIAAADRLWQFLGYEGAEGERETFDDVEVFQGIGFAARPRRGAGEAIIANVGGRAGHPVAVATHDRGTEPDDLDEDETSAHNSVAAIRFKKDGTIEATDRAGGEAVKLATLADLQALRNWLAVLVLKVTVTGTTGVTLPPGAPDPAPGDPPPVPGAPPPSPIGTSILKAQ